MNFILGLKLDINAMESDENDSSQDDTDKTVKKKRKVLFFFFLLFSFLFIIFLSFLVCFYSSNNTHNLAVPRSALSHVEGTHFISSSSHAYLEL